MASKAEKCTETYRDQLDKISKQRYDDKIALIDKKDPSTIEKQNWSKDIEKWASVTYPDIVNFLLFSTSAYTLDQLKSYKGLESYNQFVSGWVRDVSVCEINGLCLHTCKVMHSQRLSETPLSPWAIIQEEGKVLAAHCNCMAGLGEACTHIAAMLFSIEATVKVRESRTVTDTKAYWLPASLKGVQYAKIENIDFTSAKSKKKLVDSQFSDTPTARRGGMQHRLVEPPTENELNDFLQKLSLTGAQSAILSIRDPFQQPFIPQAVKEKFPQLLSDLVEDDLLRANYSDIMKHCANVKVTVSKEEAENVEEATRQQAENKLWNRFRCGRITASRMHAVCHSSPAAPSESLVRAICYPETTKFQSKATAWGCDHEKDAREAYCEGMRRFHSNFTVETTGLFLHPEYPLFGASPDGLVSCDCCGQGVLEIKCPFCVRFSSLDAWKEKNSCLEETATGRRLKQNHPYYYQVQAQIHLCDKDYADFVVWTEKEIYMERLQANSELWDEMKMKAANFHQMAVMPELVGRFYTRQNMPVPLAVRQDNNTDHATTSNDVFCICRGGETDTMVACDNQNCSYQWFHLACLKLTKSKLPKGKWYCPDCSRLPEFRSKRKCVRK
ncbi:uncharacterized protein LOC134237903 [Saccostrea cucullata]|uniref:uncharacterized protein LOC134237903 n=1 Tax=Saccostrea cuccullata TaxID=36930 RepID=UPI002ED1343F